MDLWSYILRLATKVRCAEVPQAVAHHMAAGGAPLSTDPASDGCTYCGCASTRCVLWSHSVCATKPPDVNAASITHLHMSTEHPGTTWQSYSVRKLQHSQCTFVHQNPLKLSHGIHACTKKHELDVLTCFLT